MHSADVESTHVLVTENKHSTDVESRHSCSVYSARLYEHLP